MPQSLAQRRAQHALGQIQSLQNRPHGNYPSYVSSLPATILMSGLGQASAMLLASAKLGKPNRTEDHRAYEALYNHLSSWLCRNAPDAPYPDQGNLMTAITSESESAYLNAQGEALAYLSWLKKFSDAYLQD